ncbi:4370_t:CDS:2 [Cetraspora pellucida]|uniref:DNA-directed RNA polymerase n=1 Tax=Cetraspora pellucida TaxID=1433469 RepID=A0A9N9CQQ1_9GLOM|nr:4370_t:CDS:2 [Cetraspora pellucida]
MDPLPKIRLLLNDKTTSDLIIRIDGKIYYAHKIILLLKSECFCKIFSKYKSKYFDLSCSKQSVFSVWYEYKDAVAHETEENGETSKSCSVTRDQKKVEIYYDYEIFGQFLAYCYGWSIQERTTDELFTIAYLAKKFDVPDLTNLTDSLLKFLPKSWKSDDNIWEVGLMVSKWLNLDQTRLAILEFLVNCLSNADDKSKTERIIMRLEKDDLKEVERLMLEVYGQLNANAEGQESDDDSEDSVESDSSNSEASCDTTKIEKLGNNDNTHKKETTKKDDDSSSESSDESSDLSDSSSSTSSSSSSSSSTSSSSTSSSSTSSSSSNQGKSTLTKLGSIFQSNGDVTSEDNDSSKNETPSQNMIQMDFTCDSNDTCAKAKKAFETAANIISTKIILTTPILVNASFVNLSGAAGPSRFIPLKDKDGVTRLYPQALAKQFQFDTHPEYSKYDITAAFTSVGNRFWFQGDPSPPTNQQVDIVLAIVHEMMHGLGLLSSWDNFFKPDIPDALTPFPSFIMSIDGPDTPPKNGTITFTGFQETALDRYLVFTEDGTPISTVTSNINQFAGGVNSGAKFDNKSEFIKAFKSSPQFTTAANIFKKASTASSMAFMPHDAKNINDSCLLETSIVPYLSGSSISHIDFNTFANTTDFLMVWKAPRGKTVNDFTNGTDPSNIIGPKLTKILETLGVYEVVLKIWNSGEGVLDISPANLKLEIPKKPEDFEIEKFDTERGDEKALILLDHINRKVVKQTVMTTVYGVTFIGSRLQIEVRFKEIESILQERLQKCVFSCLEEIFKGAKAIQEWLSESAKWIAKILSPERVLKSAEEIKNENDNLSEIEVGDNIKPLKKSIVKIPPNKSASDQMTAVVWTIPLDLPIVQPYRRPNKRQVKTYLQSINIIDSETPSPTKLEKVVKLKLDNSKTIPPVVVVDNGYEDTINLNDLIKMTQKSQSEDIKLESEN